MPSTVKHYVHRVGRTARAGRSGRSVSLVGESERKILKEVVKSAKTAVKARVLPPGTWGCWIEPTSSVFALAERKPYQQPNVEFDNS